MDDSISRQAAIDALKDASTIEMKRRIENIPPEPRWFTKGEIEAINAQPGPRWIPVGKPPEYPGRFLCYYEFKWRGEVRRCIDFGRYDEDDGWYVSGVKYWMPLPDEPDESYERSEDE